MWIVEGASLFYSSLTATVAVVAVITGDNKNFLSVELPWVLAAVFTVLLYFAVSGFRHSIKRLSYDWHK